MLKQFRIAGQPVHPTKSKTSWGPRMLARFPHGPLPSAQRPDVELAQLIRPGKAGPTRDVCTLKDLNQC